MSKKKLVVSFNNKVLIDTELTVSKTKVDYGFEGIAVKDSNGLLGIVDDIDFAIANYIENIAGYGFGV